LGGRCLADVRLGEAKMLLKYFYDQALAHASYLVGCQKSGTAIVVDPGRDIDGYLAVAAQNGMRIVGVAETHIHADYVSGARELADRVGARLYVSDEGPAEWKYEFAGQYDHQMLKDGDRFSVGNVQFETMHTPGHTPESVSFMLTDLGGWADQPMGIFTGDFIFVGSIGRPDLLEEAAGIFGSAKVGAHSLFASVAKFRQLPDYLQIWPAHGAGSACGKGLGAIPSSTVGYEKRFNPALQFDDEEAFVDYILADQPEAPKYFAVMKRVNKVGPKVLGASSSPPVLESDQFPQRHPEAVLIDVASKETFRQGHVPGAINLPMSGLAAWRVGYWITSGRPICWRSGGKSPRPCGFCRRLASTASWGSLSARRWSSGAGQPVRMSVYHHRSYNRRWIRARCNFGMYGRWRSGRRDISRVPRIPSWASCRIL
jgi:hydroxyacylglutathione hydrolase